MHYSPGINGFISLASSSLHGDVDLETEYNDDSDAESEEPEPDTPESDVDDVTAVAPTTVNADAWIRHRTQPQKIGSEIKVLAHQYAPFATLNHVMYQLRKRCGAPFLPRSLTFRRKLAREEKAVSRRKNSSNNSTQSLLFARLSLHAICPFRQRGKGRSLVQKCYPMEVFVYFSNIARGSLDDQYVHR